MPDFDPESSGFAVNRKRRSVFNDRHGFGDGAFFEFFDEFGNERAKILELQSYSVFVDFRGRQLDLFL